MSKISVAEFKEQQQWIFKLKGSRSLKNEDALQAHIVRHLDVNHKGVMYFHASNEDYRGTISARTRFSALAGSKTKGYPDLDIQEMRNGWLGLIIELKKKSPFKKNGEYRVGGATKEQIEWINHKRKQGYLALFSWDLKMSTDIIDRYLNGKVSWANANTGNYQKATPYLTNERYLSL